MSDCPALPLLYGDEVADMFPDHSPLILDGLSIYIYIYFFYDGIIWYTNFWNFDIDVIVMTFGWFI